MRVLTEPHIWKHSTEVPPLLPFLNLTSQDGLTRRAHVTWAQLPERKTNRHYRHSSFYSCLYIYSLKAYVLWPTKCFSSWLVNLSMS